MNDDETRLESLCELLDEGIAEIDAGRGDEIAIDACSAPIIDHGR